MSMKIFTIALFSVLCFVKASFAQTVAPGYLDGIVHFKLDDNSVLELDPYQNNIVALNLILTTFGVDTIYKPFKLPSTPLDKIYRLRFSNIALVEDLITQLELLPDVEFAEKSPIHTTSATPNDLQAGQWSLYKVQAEQAWNLTTGSSGVVIAIVDNAVMHSHVDLAANRWVNTAEQGGLPGLDDDFNGYVDDVYGYDVADGDNNPEPPPGTLNTSGFIHGTHCAGIASAVTNNGNGVAALGYNCRIMSVKCTKNTGEGNSLTNTQDGIFYAMRAGADVISMSFGAKGDGMVSQLVINQAYSSGIVLIAAAGNNNTDTAFYPGAYSNVIGVGATDQNDVRASFSNYGTWVDVMAPGVSINSTLPEGGNTYGERSGTSMATPLVAGLAGIVKSYFPSATNADIKQKIQQGCENIDGLNPGYSGKLGAGRINAYHSLSPVGILSVPDENGFSLFPNPIASGNSLFIQWKEKANEKIQIRLLDLAGKLILETQTSLQSNGQSELTEIKHLSPGAYMLSLSGTTNTITKKIIIL